MAVVRMDMALEPVTALDARFSDPTAVAVPWSAGAAVLSSSSLYWFTSLRRVDGRPHQTPLIGLWHDDAMVFTTGPGEQKAVNLAADPRCTFIAGPNAYDSGLDVVVEGVASRVVDGVALAAIADAYVAKYGEQWRFTVEGDGFVHEGGIAEVFRVAPTQAFGFAKDPYGQTKWFFGS